MSDTTAAPTPRRYPVFVVSTPETESQETSIVGLSVPVAEGGTALRYLSAEVVATMLAAADARTRMPAPYALPSPVERYETMLDIAFPALRRYPLPADKIIGWIDDLDEAHVLLLRAATDLEAYRSDARHRAELALTGVVSEGPDGVRGKPRTQREAEILSKGDPDNLAMTYEVSRLRALAELARRRADNFRLRAGVGT
ncbi:MAG: hypothetical protein JWM27_4749 [Gemmatimonadetes bacterium]|nr:hypothetical protein [Gemmatimonadota bacterium]